MTQSDKLRNYKLNDSEEKFLKYCDKKRLTVMFFHQSPLSYSKRLKSLGGKRPDFYLKTSLGECLIDVKTSKLDRLPKFTIGLEDLDKLQKTQNILKRTIFLAYPTDPWGGEDWGFISIEDVLKLKESQQNWINNRYPFVGIEYRELKDLRDLIL